MIEHCYFYSLSTDFQTRKKWQFLNRRVDMEQFRQFRWSFDQQEFVSRLLSQKKKCRRICKRFVNSAAGL